ncbi:MAG: hypothetical protein LLF76_03050 [Planctomycetaceae bacterium]|nr:hypothetical protein [Planctomycetaceae bacterium]
MSGRDEIRLQQAAVNQAMQDAAAAQHRLVIEHAKLERLTDAKPNTTEAEK